ncbi:hypothetical protein [Kitasatospora sp. NPDC056273]|uniref:hypothetical protein n=1 Tax=Kitasatospora sp. NPDC056273 TaxID=3345769 RepID=UPI0035D9520F
MAPQDRSSPTTNVPAAPHATSQTGITEALLVGAAAAAKVTARLDAHHTSTRPG